MKPNDPKASYNAEAATRYDDHLRGDEDMAVHFLADLEEIELVSIQVKLFPQALKLTSKSLYLLG